MKTNVTHLSRMLIVVATFLFIGIGCKDSISPLTPYDNSRNARSGDNGFTTNSTPTGAYTVRYKFTEYQRRAVAANTTSGGIENLVNTTNSAYIVFTEMANGSDRLAYTPASGTTPSSIEDQDHNFWVLYIPSDPTKTAFKNATPTSYIIVKGIDWSSGNDKPVAPDRHKLRFTID